MGASPVTDKIKLADEVTEYVLQHIQQNRLTLGSPLPSEVQISSHLGISRGVVREAYRSLHSAGILEISNGRAPRVGLVQSSSFALVLGHALSTGQVWPEEVLDLRCAIEVRAAELAAEKRTLDHVRTLHAAIVGMRASQGRADKFVQHDVKFHETIGEATGNLLYKLISSALRQSMEASIVAGLKSRTTKAQMDRVYAAHEAITAAIEERDAPKAAEAMRVHFSEADAALREANRIKAAAAPRANTERRTKSEVRQ